MPKDSQPDHKRAHMEKCKGQTPITAENQNQNPGSKKQSVKKMTYKGENNGKGRCAQTESK